MALATARDWAAASVTPFAREVYLWTLSASTAATADVGGDRSPHPRRGRGMIGAAGSGIIGAATLVLVPHRARVGVRRYRNEPSSYYLFITSAPIVPCDAGGSATSGHRLVNFMVSLMVMVGFDSKYVVFVLRAQ